MKVCPNCNTQYDDNCVHCVRCGSELKYLGNPSVPQTQQPYPNYSAAQTNKIRSEFPNIKIILIVAAIVFGIGMIVNFSIATDKKENYKNSEYSSSSHNAYVGGDAYNYIINSNYYTAYNVLGVGCLVCSALSVASLIFILAKEKEYKRLDLQNEKLAKIEELLSNPDINKTNIVQGIKIPTAKQ